MRGFRPLAEGGGRIKVGIEMVFDQGQTDAGNIVTITFRPSKGDGVIVEVEGAVQPMLVSPTVDVRTYAQLAMHVNQTTAKRVKDRYRLDRDR